MTEEQFLALLEQVNKNTQAIEELKEAILTLDVPQEILDGIKACECNENEIRQMISNQQAEIDKLKEKPSGPQMELVGTTLNITLPVAESTTTTEEAAAAEETTEST